MSISSGVQLAADRRGGLLHNRLAAADQAVEAGPALAPSGGEEKDHDR
ncbi:hypothetical protein ACFV0C_38500 [Streptomyces sp. NPDC059568]